MGVIITSSSDYGKELAKWEMFPQPWAPSPGRPFMQREFPLMVYRAAVRFDGKASVGEGDDRIFGGAPGSAEQFTNELMAAIRAQRTEELKRRYREQCDLLVFEDVQFLRGKRQTQLELLHTLECAGLDTSTYAEPDVAPPKTRHHLPRFMRRGRAGAAPSPS